MFGGDDRTVIRANWKFDILTRRKVLHIKGF